MEIRYVGVLMDGSDVRVHMGVAATGRRATEVAGVVVIVVFVVFMVVGVAERPVAVVVFVGAAEDYESVECSGSDQIGGEVGKNGLAGVSWGDWSVSAADVPPIDGVVVGAVDVDGPTPFEMIATWTYLSVKPKINLLTEALEAWADWLDTPLVVAGDFNTGCSWHDITTGPMSHFPLVDQLGELGLQTAYHAANGVEQGVGEASTPWHNSGRVGDEATWRSRSDHAPVVVDIDWFIGSN